MVLHPKYSQIKDWCLISGMTRTATFAAIKCGHLRAIKPMGGRRTLIDVEAGLAWLNGEPSLVRAA